MKGYDYNDFTASNGFWIKAKSPEFEELAFKLKTFLSSPKHDACRDS